MWPRSMSRLATSPPPSRAPRLRCAASTFHRAEPAGVGREDLQSRLHRLVRGRSHEPLQSIKHALFRLYSLVFAHVFLSRTFVRPLYFAGRKDYTFPVSEREKRRVRWREGGREGGMRERLRNRPRLSPKVYGYLTEEKETLRQGFAALFLSSAGELIAGIVLAGISGTLDELVGLAVLIPAAIGMRGAIFGAMGSRLSTSIQTGLFRLDLRRGVLAENVQAAAVLSLVSGVFLALLARVLCGILGVRTELSVIDYVVISTAGGIIAGVLLLGITVFVARPSVARPWDMDNIAAPMLTAA